jgi:hypothetical protein
MKYAFFIFSILLSIQSAFAQSASVTPIKSFDDSDALVSVVQFMNDVREDLPNAVTLSDKKTIIKDTTKCFEVTSEEVFTETLKGIKKVLRFYPDEELPLEEAVADLESYLGSKSYSRCVFEKTTKEHIIKTIYFFDLKDKTHLRVDNWTLLTAGQ